MATENFSSPHLSTASEGGPDVDADADANPGPLFIPAAYDFPDAIDKARLPGIAVRSFLTHVNRIAGGCQVVNDLLMQEHSDDPHRLPGDPHSPPVILNDFHRGQLQLLLSASWASLAKQAAQFADWAYEVHTEEGCARGSQGRPAAWPARRTRRLANNPAIPGFMTLHGAVRLKTCFSGINWHFHALLPIIPENQPQYAPSHRHALSE